MLSLCEASPGSCLPLSTFDTRRAMERPTASGHSQHTDWERLTVCERVASSGGAWVAGWSSRTPPSQAGVVSSPLVTVGGSASREATRGCVRSTGGQAPAPARRGASGPRRALRPRRHIAVVHFADLPPLHQAMQRTGDRPLGEAGGLAHLGRPEPLRPRGREGRQDLPLTTGGRGGRRWGHRAILSSVIDRMLASFEDSTACTCMLRQVMACARLYSYQFFVAQCRREAGLT